METAQIAIRFQPHFKHYTVENRRISILSRAQTRKREKSLGIVPRYCGCTLPGLSLAELHHATTDKYSRIRSLFTRGAAVAAPQFDWEAHHSNRINRVCRFSGCRPMNNDSLLVRMYFIVCFAIQETASATAIPFRRKLSAGSGVVCVAIS